MTLYTGTILITELMMLTMIIHVLKYSGFTREEKTWYVISFLTVMFCAYAEYCAITLDNRGPSYIRPLTILTVIQFSLTPLLPVFFSGALGLHEQAKRVGIVFSLNIVVETISACYGCIFYFNENGMYFRGRYYFIYEAFYISSLLFLIGALFVVGKRFQHRDKFTILMVLVIMVAAIVPLILYKVYTDYLGIGVCACICYIYYNDLIQEDIQAKLVSNQNRISVMQEHIISGLANLIENRDTETGEHVFRTSNYVRALATAAMKDGVYTDQIDSHFINLMYSLAPMHDIGKIVVPDSILKKPGRLTEEEFEEMKRHASEGGKVVREILEGVTDEEHLNFASDIATYHHERWDGKGYPAQLAGEEIPLSARIMAIADVFDALVSVRCYKKAMAPDQALEIIRSDAGSHFDPRLAKVFLDHKETFLELMNAKEVKAEV